MTFKEYIARRRITDTPTGDFVIDARADKRMPDFDNWPALEGYLRYRCGACWEAIDAGKKVWCGYIRQRGKL